MNRFNTLVGKLNFKKIFAVYLAAAVVCGICAAAAVGYVYKDKINLAWQYEKAGDAFEKGNNINESVRKLADSSKDITDVLILDKSNHILYSANDTRLAWDNVFELEKSEQGGKFLKSAVNPDAVFRFVKKDDFMLSAVFADDFTGIHEEYDEDNFYHKNFENKKLYMLSLLAKGRDGTKAYVVSDPKSVPQGITALKIAASLLMLLFMIYWIIVALWVYGDAAKSHLSAPVWGIVTLFSNLAGVLVYVMYKHINATCGFCGAVQPKSNVFCTFCGKKIGLECPKCGHSMKHSDNYCPKCGHKAN